MILLMVQKEIYGEKTSGGKGSLSTIIYRVIYIIIYIILSQVVSWISEPSTVCLGGVTRWNTSIVFDVFLEVMKCCMKKLGGVC